MKSLGVIAILAVFFGVNLASAANISFQPQASITFKSSEDFSFGARGTLHGGTRLDQTENLLTPGERQRPIIPFVNNGYNGYTAAPWFAISLATIKTIDISGGGEVTVLSRKTDRDKPLYIGKETSIIDSVFNSPDYFEVRPAASITFKMPVGNLVSLSFSNRLERRLFRAPTVSGEFISYLRYGSEFLFSTVPVTSLKMSPYFVYNGYTQTNARHLSRAGAGISISPINGLVCDLAYRVLWVPSGRNQSEHQIGLEAGYTFDFTK